MSACAESIWQLYPMDRAHLSQVLTIESASYEFPWTRGIFEDCLAAGYSAWVVVTQGEVIAYALLSMGAGEGHVLNICSRGDCRRQGLARFLLRHLIMIGRAADLDRILLEVRVSNLAAQRLYEDFGFAAIGQRKKYYPARNGREDAVVLALNLKEFGTGSQL